MLDEHLSEAQSRNAHFADEVDRLKSDLKESQQKGIELEEELRAASRANESLHQQMQSNPPGRTEIASSKSALLDSIEDLTRERNNLAAELAALRASQPAPKRASARAGGHQAGGMTQPSLLPEQDSGGTPG